MSKSLAYFLSVLAAAVAVPKLQPRPEAVHTLPSAPQIVDPWDLHAHWAGLP
jgi:hypothetical protein